MRPRYASRDILTKREARKRVKTLLSKAQEGDLDSAHVLADTLVYAGHPQLGEDLALALSGRAWGVDEVWSHTLGRHLERGEALLGDRRSHVMSVMKRIKTALFPPKRSACMPNRRAFIRLVEQTHGAPLDRDATRIARRLWKAMQEACTKRDSGWGRLSAYGRAMTMANDSLAGHGIEGIRGAETRTDYVNMGDPYIETLIVDYVSGRFRVASYADAVEEIERRQRRPRRRRRRRVG